MKKFMTFLGVLILTLFVCLPAQAQRRGGWGGNRGGGSHFNGGQRGGQRGGGGWHQGGQRNDGGQRGGWRRQPRDTHRAGPQGGFGGHYGHFQGDRGHHTNEGDGRHFDGRHFDRDYYGHHFGRDHRFRIGHPVWYYSGWRFWYGGFWFQYYDVWPQDWCWCDDVWIEFDPVSECYYLYDAEHPGVRVHVFVVY